MIPTNTPYGFIYGVRSRRFSRRRRSASCRARKSHAGAACSSVRGPIELPRPLRTATCGSPAAPTTGSRGSAFVSFRTTPYERSSSTKARSTWSRTPSSPTTCVGSRAARGCAWTARRERRSNTSESTSPIHACETSACGEPWRSPSIATPWSATSSAARLGPPPACWRPSTGRTTAMFANTATTLPPPSGYSTTLATRIPTVTARRSAFVSRTRRRPSIRAAASARCCSPCSPRSASASTFVASSGPPSTTTCAAETSSSTPWPGSAWTTPISSSVSFTRR